MVSYVQANFLDLVGVLAFYQKWIVSILEKNGLMPKVIILAFYTIEGKTHILCLSLETTSDLRVTLTLGIVFI
jgi:hypothetical protein